jgi:L-arabinose isomerase
MIVNAVDCTVPEELSKLPVARALWAPRPGLKTAAAAWIYAGGAHHTAFSQSVTAEYLEDFAEIADIELLVIDDETTEREFKNTLKWNSAYYSLRQH